MFRWKGNKLELDIFGASHSAEIGVEMRGFPQKQFDMNELLQFLSRRKANASVYSTSRAEADTPVFTDGVADNNIVSDTVRAKIVNGNVRSHDYDNLYGKPRPSHADYAAYLKDGRMDFSGGGEFSGRMTAPYCIAGGIAKQMLERQGIYVNAYVASVGSVKGASYKTSNVSFLNGCTRQQCFPSVGGGEQMLEEIQRARVAGDSVGGIVECVVENLRGGVGNALFGGLEGQIAYLLYAIPAVKGVEFGSGFDLATMYGSTANDALQIENGNIVTKTNHAGGINGGISNGMPLTLAVCFRPTPSISLPQQTVDLVTRQNVEISVIGRHDSCIVPRAVPVVESAVALALLDNI